MSKGDLGIGFLFDLDGVIIDSESEYTKIWAQINQEFPTGIEDLEHKIKGCTLTKILQENYNDDATRQSVKERLHFLESKMKYEYLPGAKEFLEELNKRNLPCVLVTSSDSKKMEHLREEQPHLHTLFDFIVTGDLVKTSKPSPEGYHLGAEKIKCLPQKCVVFEDSLQGVMAGRNAGSFVVAVLGTIPEEKLAPYADIIVENLGEIDIDNLIQTLKTR